MSSATFKEATPPPTPPSGYVVFYAKTDGLLYFKDDAGAETPVKVLSGPGSGLDADTVDGIEGAVLVKVDGSTPFTAGNSAGAVAQSFGTNATEGYEIKVVDETVSALAAISTDLTADIPSNAYLLSVQANIETLIVAGGTSVKVGIGPISNPDKYGITSALTKNLKIDTIPVHAVLSVAEDVQINMCATGGGIGDTVATAGAVRVRIVYALPNSLIDAV